CSAGREIISVGNQTLDAQFMLSGIGGSDYGLDKVRSPPEERLPVISVIIPVLNEEENIAAAYDAVRDVFARVQDRFDFEIIFTANHSAYRSFEIISRLAQKDRRVRGVRFTRNFGFHRSVLTGMRLASGDAAVQIDCDLQDPPAAILDFIESWLKGHDVVVGV